MWPLVWKWGTTKAYLTVDLSDNVAFLMVCKLVIVRPQRYSFSSIETVSLVVDTYELLLSSVSSFVALFRCSHY